MALRDKRGEGSRLGNLGRVYLALGQYQQAVIYHEPALSIAREIGNKRLQANELKALGNAYLALGQYERAVDCFKQARIIFASLEVHQIVNSLDPVIAQLVERKAVPRDLTVSPSNIPKHKAATDDLL